MLDTFYARKDGLLHEAERRESSARPPKLRHLLSDSSSDSESSAGPPPSYYPTLPIEILDFILQYLQSQNDLCNVAISNKHLSDVAMRSLYHTIKIGFAKPMESVKCLQTLSKNPRLALMVRSFDIHWSNISYPTRNLYTLAVRALSNTSLLNTLSIDVPSDFHPWDLSSCTFQLKKFSASFPCDQSLIQFLEAQPSLLDLTLRGFNSDPAEFSFNLNTFNLNPNPVPFALSPEALPRLTRLRAIHAGPDIISSILKGRPVTQVSMPLYADCVCRSLDVLNMSSEPIERLNIISFDPNAPVYLLDEIADRLPYLEALHIVILLAQCSEALLEALTPSLKKFKALQYLTYMSATSSDDVSQDDEQNIAAMWHTSCPTLKTIILPMGKVWFIDNCKWTCLED
ncbi:hypothetical protein EV361DRAFT_794719 [Lentinula raphanica]|uniref:F-box domain-containing protein n=1 Tax=Lentinula raphanica TaxID=153919 RepID=A0AA38PGL4_9AGAR|nr:hypothetical protein C8R42DRAFT_568175 [Lentinula raphanica]KAJ3761319.1 hypothetical protein EV360DRAFT_38030 [Lentinula raphanica]KAJ3772599.1 hypothetical protein FB446DRAFT_643242 [Lentinula raphanica]KAJ3828744.1 hypothetical protein F5880DRAFT_1471975 [Lentinula raphanica]KAJ3842538.1 hypothetical protein F5878DRAFT_529648 [Lentinula raphanica]